MRRFLTHLVALAVLGLGTAAFAQTDLQKDKKDAREDQRDLNKDRKDINQDQRDLNKDRADRNKDVRDIKHDEAQLDRAQKACKNENKQACEKAERIKADIAKDRKSVV